MDAFKSFTLITNCQSAGEEEQLGNEMIAGKLSTGMIARKPRAQQARRKATE